MRRQVVSGWHSSFSGNSCPKFWSYNSPILHYHLFQPSFETDKQWWSLKVLLIVCWLYKVCFKNSCDMYIDAIRNECFKSIYSENSRVKNHTNNTIPFRWTISGDFPEGLQQGEQTHCISKLHGNSLVRSYKMRGILNMFPSWNCANFHKQIQSL